MNKNKICKKLKKLLKLQILIFKKKKVKLLMDQKVKKLKIGENFIRK